MKKTYQKPATSSITLTYSSMLAQSALSSAGGDIQNIVVEDTEYEDEFNARAFGDLLEW